MNQYQTGNTVRLTSEFRDWDGNIIDPSSVKLIIYDSRYSKIDEIGMTSSNKEDVGKYYHEYTFTREGDHVYEWNADIDGTTSLKRNRIRISFN